jgi:Ni,Fe-hydrogenase III large subunit/Ni,Fe-hydrogenase III component G
VIPARLRTVPVSRVSVRGDVQDLLRNGYRALLLHAENVPDGVRLAYTLARPAPAGEDRVELALEVPVTDAWVPSTASSSYPLGRFEREIRDLFGVEPRDHPLPRRLVRHAHWPRGWHPLLGEATQVPDFDPDESAFPFLEVAGDGVYEIPVGPVHAGLIEPGHFRFSVVGETIVRMKARLWYVHRGVERHLENLTAAEAMPIVERVSGDTAVGHAVAFALACEEALGIEVPATDRTLRALLLELERLYNHAGDLGAILNDVAFSLPHSHLQRIRENLLRLNASVTGHRLLRGAVGVGSTRVLELPDIAVVGSAADEIADIVDLALGHPMVVDRLAGTAVLSTEDAVRIGVLGYVARASGVELDARRDHPFLDPRASGVEPAGVVEPAGDVLARFRVRAREVADSARLVALLSESAGGQTGRDPGVPSEMRAGIRRGLGIVEAWRGLLCHRVTLDAAGRLRRVKIVDPSFMTWPGLPVALADTIVPDFPLANKSFNQSYAGNDL